MLPVHLAFWSLSSIGPVEWVIIAIAAVLLFGKRLPEIGRSLGRGIVEFKKGLRGMQDEIESAGADDSKTSDEAVAKRCGDTSRES